MTCHTSTADGITVRGAPDQIIQKWDGLAYGAEKAGDHVKANIYFQQSEHWRRFKNDQKESPHNGAALDTGRGRRLARPLARRYKSDDHS